MGSGTSSLKEQSDKCIVDGGVPVYLKKESDGGKSFLNPYKLVCYKNDGLNKLSADGYKSLGGLNELGKNKLSLGEELNKCSSNNGVLLPKLNDNGKFILSDGKKYDLSCELNVDKNIEIAKGFLDCHEKEGIMALDPKGKKHCLLPRKTDKSDFLPRWEIELSPEDNPTERPLKLGFLGNFNRHTETIVDRTYK